VTFSVEPKLRTLLWQWAGTPLTDEAIECVQELRTNFGGALGQRLSELLTTREVRRTLRRIENLLRELKHPLPSGDWPAMPWPPM
jgi:uncharacterized repeat protein (TIGR03843 family)